MPHEKYGKVKNNPKSKYENNPHSKGGYNSGGMSGTSSESSYYRPIDGYKKGHEY